MKSLFIAPKSIPTDKGIFEFSKVFTMDCDITASINIYAACRYILYVNGEYVCEGPCRSASDIRYYETVDINLKSGENEIRVTVMHVTDEMDFSSCLRSIKPMVIAECFAGDVRITTDTTWRCEYIESRELMKANSLYDRIAFVPPFEYIKGRRNAVELPVEECGFFDFTGEDRNIYGIGKPVYLAPRPIPIIYPQEPAELKIINRGEGFIELDSGEYITAKVEFDLKAGCTYKILYAECYQFGEDKRLRDDISGELRGAYDVVCSEEDMTFAPFWYRAFRFVRIECENPAENVVAARAYRVNYPFDITGSFECSDENYNKMWDISINTLKCCAHEIYMDCPFYEQQQYVMDTAIECAVTMRLTHDTSMVRKCISEFAASQQPSGMLCANYPCSYVQIIPGFSFFFVYLLRDYLEYSKDVEFAARYTGVMDKIFACFDNQVRDKGYIHDSIYWDYQDWVDGWYAGKPPVAEGEAITTYNMYYACALKDAAYICRKVGRSGLAEDYEKRYAQIKDMINSRCFDEAKGMYRDGTNSDNYSVHTAIWSILSGVAPEDKLGLISEKLFDMSIKRASFSMNYYLFRAIEKCGIYDKAFGLFDGWQEMIDNHCTTWCENPGNPRSECHAWSCAPTHEFSSNILGVKHSFEDEINIIPYTGGLTYAKGRVPTRFGFVDVHWETDGGKFTILVNAPQGVTKNIVMPDGSEYTFTEKSAGFQCEI
ncbi:MAG: hypothetical protein IJ460_05090 [Clostridia bacterium]|nr:hypothetical protein [Clostridia bacterium]